MQQLLLLPKQPAYALGSAHVSSAIDGVTKLTLLLPVVALTAAQSVAAALLV